MRRLGTAGKCSTVLIYFAGVYFKGGPRGFRVGVLRCEWSVPGRGLVIVAGRREEEKERKR